MDFDVMNLLTPLPAPSSPPPAVPSGTVVVYRDPLWKNAGATLKITDYRAGIRHTIPANGFDSATCIAYNLPVGVVMTLVDHMLPHVPGADAVDLRCRLCH